AGVVDNPAGEFATLFVQDADDVGAFELALNIQDAGRKKTGFSFEQRSTGALVDDNRSVDRRRESDPAPLTANLCLRKKQRADFITGKAPVDHPLDPAVRNHGCAAGTGRDSGCFEFRLHATAAEAGSSLTTREILDCRSYFLNKRNQLRGTILVWIGRVQTVDVG